MPRVTVHQSGGDHESEAVYLEVEIDGHTFTLDANVDLTKRHPDKRLEVALRHKGGDYGHDRTLAFERLRPRPPSAI